MIPVFPFRTQPVQLMAFLIKEASGRHRTAAQKDANYFHILKPRMLPRFRTRCVVHHLYRTIMKTVHMCCCYLGCYSGYSDCCCFYFYFQLPANVAARHGGSKICKFRMSYDFHRGAPATMYHSMVAFVKPHTPFCATTTTIYISYVNIQPCCECVRGRRELSKYSST